MASQVQSALRNAGDGASRSLAELAKRIYIPLTPSSPAGLVEADTVDPWKESGKYAMAWTYFAVCLMMSVTFMRFWHFWQDKIRQAIYKQQVEEHYQKLYALEIDWDRSAALPTGASGRHFFPDEGIKDVPFRPKAHFSSIPFVNATLALFRWVFYRPIPDIVWRKHRFTFSSLAALACGFIAFVYVTVYCFLKQPLYWQSIQYGSPPLAIRSGMFALSMTPWIMATGTKVNILTLITGIGPERLNVLHRWAGYLCLFLSLLHTFPFLVQPVWEDGGWTVWKSHFPKGAGIIYGSGLASLVPLVWLCGHSLPMIRRRAYEVFLKLHWPIGLVYVAILFWHTKNALMSWAYLESSFAIFFLCLFVRVVKLNWVRPWRRSFLVGDEAAINIMSENAIKITIPTQMRWKQGQHFYLRMPGIAIFENHPFTVSSLCSDDFPSEYGEEYRDCVLVFKPLQGFTRRVLETAIEKGPYHTYRAFLDGPYGGMHRDLAAFDTCILIAGGSGITSLVSQLLNLIKRMRDGKAITKRIVVVWSMRHLEAMDWFHEELRICRESAPPESVTCKFFVTSGVPEQYTGISHRAPRPLSNMFHDKLDGFIADIASKRNSALIMSEARGDPERERELRAEDEDRITALPQQKYLQPHTFPPHPPGSALSARMAAADESLRKLEGRNQEADAEHQKENWDDSKKGEFHFTAPQRGPDSYPHFNSALPNSPYRRRVSQNMEAAEVEREVKEMDASVDSVEEETTERPVHAPELAHLRTDVGEMRRSRTTTTFGAPSGFDFGFSETPTDLQKNLKRPSLLVPHQIDGGWSVEYGRPDLENLLKEWATGGTDGRGILGRRTAVFVCGPAAMRVGVATTVARLQAEIWGDDELEEIFLYTENYDL